MFAALTATLVSTAPASVAEPGDSARGTVKIEDSEFGDSDNPNEVKVGCDFSVEFFGMDAGPVPVTFTLLPPSGDDVIARRTAQVEEARGNESSGSLKVDLSDELSDIPRAQADDFNFKVRVDAEVKSTRGNDGITKSAVLFIVCAPGAGGPGNGGPGGAGPGGGGEVPNGGVSAGYGGTAANADGPPAWTPWSMTALAGLFLAACAVAGRRLTRRPGA
jgi:hypothetical protein